MKNRWPMRPLLSSGEHVIAGICWMREAQDRSWWQSLGRFIFDKGRLSAKMIIMVMNDNTLTNNCVSTEKILYQYYLNVK